jgi:hypothetical protein
MGGTSCGEREGMVCKIRVLERCQETGWPFTLDFEEKSMDLHLSGWLHVGKVHEIMFYYGHRDLSR